MKFSGITARRRVAGVAAGCLLGGVAAATIAAPTAAAAPDQCAAQRFGQAPFFRAGGTPSDARREALLAATAPLTSWPPPWSWSPSVPPWAGS